MPGFNIAPFGGGYSPEGPSNTVEMRRKHRWVFETIGRGEGVFAQAELLLLQSANRPSFKFQDVEAHHNQEVSKYAGKQEWEPITLTWYDGEQNPDISRGLYHWLETVVNIRSVAVAHPRYYKRSASLKMLDGTGQATETWEMYGTWCGAVNWGDLDYASTDIQTCEATMIYDRAVRICNPFTGPQTISPSCPNLTGWSS